MEQRFIPFLLLKYQQLCVFDGAFRSCTSVPIVVHSFSQIKDSLAAYEGRSLPFWLVYCLKCVLLSILFRSSYLLGVGGRYDLGNPFDGKTCSEYLTTPYHLKANHLGPENCKAPSSQYTCRVPSGLENHGKPGK